MDASEAQGALLQLIRQAAAGVAPRADRESSGASSHNSSVCSETDESIPSQPDVSTLLQAIVSAANQSTADKRSAVYSSVPGWEDAIPSPEDSEFDRYRAHLEIHLPGFVYFEREALKRTQGKGRSGRSYFCRQIRKTITDHGITGERHINLDKAVDQVLLYCPALERSTDEREEIKRRIGNSLNCQRRHQNFKRAGDNYVKGPCKRRGEKKAPPAEEERQETRPKGRSKKIGEKTWKLGDEVELLMEDAVVGRGIVVMLEVKDTDTQEMNEGVGGVQVTEKTEAGEEPDNRSAHVSWELHSAADNFRWGDVEIGNVVSWDWVNLRHKEKELSRNVKVDKWVGVAYDDGVYVGQVQKVNKKGPVVKYLEYVGEGKAGGNYMWPRKDDIDTPNKEYILMMDVPVVEGTKEGYFNVSCHEALKSMYDDHTGV
ncbi:uncharacterized protein LOC144923563 [Branchiostoma floridae x Branchiostoma belcheri]